MFIILLLLLTGHFACTIHAMETNEVAIPQNITPALPQPSPLAFDPTGNEFSHHVTPFSNKKQLVEATNQKNIKRIKSDIISVDQHNNSNKYTSKPELIIALNSAISKLKFNSNSSGIENLLKNNTEIFSINDNLDISNNTLLHKAVLQQNYNLVEYLVQNGAHIDAKNTSGQTPLDIFKASKGIKPFVREKIETLLTQNN